MGLGGAYLRCADAELVGFRGVERGEVDADEHGADQQDDGHGEQDGTRVPGAGRRMGHVQGVLVRVPGVRVVPVEPVVPVAWCATCWDIGAVLD